MRTSPEIVSCKTPKTVDFKVPIIACKLALRLDLYPAWLDLQPVIRSQKADSEQAVKIDDSFYLNGGFQVDIAPVDVLA
jgi:hypothetical protein